MPSPARPSLPAEIALSSGGARGVCALGAVSALHHAGYLVRVERYSGTSVGALIAAGLALGRSPDTMLAAALRHPLQPDLAPGHFGMDRGRGLAKFIKKVLGLRRKVTFAELPNLRVCVYNATKRRPEYWDHTTHPGMPIAFAVRVSCTVPFVFGAVRFRGDLYVDGAVADPTPVVHANRTLALQFRRPAGPVDSIESFATALRYLPATQARWVVELETDLDPLNFHAETHVLKNAFEHGRAQAAHFVKKNLYIRLHMSAPGSGAMLQLAALGAQNKYLLGTFSYFSRRFKRATRFAMWTEDIAADYVPDARVRVDIPRSGDLLTECYLLITLPVVPGGGYWPASVGYALFRRIRLSIDETEVHNTERLWYDLHDALHTRQSHVRGLNGMIGKTPLSKAKAHELYVPLRFLSCGKGRVRAPLPLCAIRNPPKVDIEWESLEVLGLTVDPGITAKVLVDYVELDEAEKREFLKPVTLAFDTVLDSDATSYYVDVDGELHDAPKIRVNVSNVRFPVKMIVFVSYVDGSLFEYLEGTLDKINVTFNNLDRFSARPLAYFQGVQRYSHCRRADGSGPGVYSFAIDATSRHSTGYADFAGLKRVVLEATVAKPSPRFKLKVFSVYTNVLRLGGASAALGLS